MGTLVDLTVNGLMVGSVYALVAIGLTLAFGVMHILHFAHGEFYMLGGVLAYVSTSSLRLPYLLSAVLAVAGTVIVGLVVQWLILRRLEGRPITSTAIATLGLMVVMQSLGLALLGPMPRSLIMPSPDGYVSFLGATRVSYERIIVLIVTVIAIVAVRYVLKHTGVGLAIRATFQNRESASVSGINVERIDKITFGLASGLAGAAGVLLGSLFSVTHNMGVSMTLKAWLIVIIGGLGSVVGAVVAALLLGVIESFALLLTSTHAEVLGLVLVLLVLLVKPQGLFTKGI